MSSELLLCVVFALLVFVWGSGTAKAIVPDSPIDGALLENRALRVVIDGDNGAIVSVFHKKSGIELISNPAAARARPPWELFLGRGDAPHTDFIRFTLARDSESAVTLTWSVEPDLTIVATIELPPGDEPLLLYSQVENATSHEVASLTFPVIRGIRALQASGQDDYLAHPIVTGFLFRNPNLLFSIGAPWGVRHARYPSGEGAPMQFMAYYTDGVGGFYFGAHDPHLTMKEIDFYFEPRAPGVMPGLVASFRHWNWDRAPVRDLHLDYPIVIAPLERGDWYEAAERYREWAERQAWVRRGKLRDRTDDQTARWLNEEVGLSTFGAKGNQWNPAFFERLAHDLETPIFHILYGQPIPNGGNLHQDNLSQIRAHGGRFSTFENDILVPLGAPDFNRSAQIEPYQEINWGSWRAAWMDPTTEYIQNRQKRRAELLMQAYAPDAFYYDISTSFAPMGCLDPTHEHEQLGYGRWMVHAYQEFHAQVREAAMAARMTTSDVRYLPMGTEGIHEGALMSLDFYQARATAYPASFDFEGREFGSWIASGAARKIPMFTYVYHEYGGIRLDGWGHLSDEEGDYAYAVAARTALWGGIYQLNYEFRSFESPASSEKLRFMQEIALARTGYGRAYLAYGRMLPAPRFDVDEIELEYRVRNLPFGIEERSGKQRVPAVIASAWQGASNHAAFFFVNVDTRPRTIEWDFNPDLYGLDSTNLQLKTQIGGEIVPSPSWDGIIRLTLPPRRVVMVEASL